MISLGGLELNKYLQVPDWYTATSALGSDRGPTLGGRVVLQRLVGVSAKRVTLTAVQEGNRLLGYFRRSDVEAIRAMADQGDPVDFIYHDNTVSVIIPLDGINLSMVGYRTDPPATHPYVGTVSLLVR